MTIIVQSDHLTAGAWAAKWTLSKRRTDYRILDRPCRKHELAESTHSGPSCDFTCDWSKLNA